MKSNWSLRNREGEVRKRKELKAIFAKHHVKLAYLFGSHARRTVSQFSDVDIAVLFEKKREKREIDRLRIELMNLLKAEALDLIPLNHAPPLLKYQVVREGIVLYGKKCASTFEVKALEEYFDFKPYEERFFEKMEERLQRGEYGK
ncbi:MAG: nucleotidyltransferase domain-containing protein [Candidatus Korarchaeota archaeon]|nr:nucleotidyltransferase domain-containing protein [Candidatus Korarchaeota archaeon]NIU84059.1 hypothetical protein [Candidatus Thorarchaeota archaeon]NIW12774.1 hypothetical protein [Candidatus Thorarchaeota archaeon]NIW50981.1 hypothetical protein [Candidatus Korarchaeota archaeon]